MKSLRFFPLTFVAGAHGFAFFAPYVALVLAALLLRLQHRRRAGEKDALAVRASADTPLLAGV